MKEVLQVSNTVYRIISEPGDATRYDYFVHRDGPDEFCFMPGRSTFSFPQRFNIYEVKDKSEEEIIQKAKDMNVNMWTLKECIRTAEGLFSGEILPAKQIMCCEDCGMEIKYRYAEVMYAQPCKECLSRHEDLGESKTEDRIKREDSGRGL